MRKVILMLAASIAVIGVTMANAEDIAALASPTADVITSVQSANSTPSLEGTLKTADVTTTKVRQPPSKKPPGQRRNNNQQAAPAKNSNTDTSTEKRA